MCTSSLLSFAEGFLLQTVTKTMPENNIHMGDSELGGRQMHSHYHNVLSLGLAVLFHFIAVRNIVSLL